MSTLSGPLIHLFAKDVQGTGRESMLRHVLKACVKSKDFLISSQVMAHYDPYKPLVLAVDASGYGLGVVISHTDGVNENPIAYASRTFSN